MHSPETWEGRLRCDEDIILDEEWDDGNWIPFGVLNQMEKTSLNQYKGKYVIRTKSTDLNLLFLSSVASETA